MTPAEIDRIAAAMNCLRPDWPVASLRTLLSRPDLARRGRRDVAVALTWVACESATTTPARVVEAGPWWRAAGVEGDVTHGPPRTAEACEVCGRHELSCICPPEERPDRNGGVWRPSQPAANVHEHTEALRALLRQPKETSE